MKRIFSRKGIVVIIVLIIITLFILFNDYASANAVYSSADSISAVASISGYMQVRLKPGESLDVETRSPLPVFICFTDGKIKIINWGDTFRFTALSVEEIKVLNIYKLVFEGCKITHIN